MDEKGIDTENQWDGRFRGSHVTHLLPRFPRKTAWWGDADGIGVGGGMVWNDMRCSVDG